jgi:hypothetical protein
MEFAEQVCGIPIKTIKTVDDRKGRWRMPEGSRANLESARRSVSRCQISDARVLRLDKGKAPISNFTLNQGNS